MLNIYKVPTEEVTKIEWKDDFLDYDRQLSQLGNEHEEFLVVNPEFEHIGLHNLINSLPPTPGIKCIVWKYNGTWLAKYFNKNWNPEMDYWPIVIKLIWEKNPDISESIPFLNDPINCDILDPFDLHYNMEWYLDSHFNLTDEKIWIRRCRLSGLDQLGTKDMGYISPKVRIKYNPDIKDVKYDFDLSIPWYELNYEHVWYLDERFNSTDEKVWAIKVKLLDGVIKPVKDMGYVSPKYRLKYNPDIKDVKYDFDLSIPWYELNYEHVWYLDEQFNPTDEKVWAVKFKLINGIADKPVKDMGYISPKYRLKYNPDIKDVKYDFDLSIPWYELNYEHVWYLDERFNSTDEKVWAVKFKLINGIADKPVKDMGYISPKYRLKYNPDIKDVKYDFDLSIPWYELNYEHVWYLDERFNSTDEKVWAVKFKLINGIADKPVKDMGYVSPKYRLKYNPDIKDVKYDFDLSIPWYELNYEHVWYLDERFNSTDEKVWAVKFKLINGIADKPVKDMGYVSPKYRLKYNPDIPKIDFDFKLSMPWHELNYEHVWYLDERFNPTNEKVWAIKFKIANGIPKQTKDMGYISPTIIYNPDLPVMDYTIDDHIPYYDLSYEHVWTVDERLVNGHEEVWAAKIVPHESEGVKVVGNIKCNLPEQLDVVFISYNEINAEVNWQKVLTKFPTAKRVDGIKGIVAAHKQAASIVTTDMFYVVDGDAELADYWDFKFQPNLFDRDCVHVWRSINPVNDLKYGYGGVKLFPTKLVISADPNNTDMTTSLGDKFKLMPKVSNTTSFNSDEFSTWRSAFRECAKLSGKTVKRQLSRETEKRLDIWCTMGKDRAYGKYSIAGAIAGRRFGEENRGNDKILQQVNDYDWLRTKFNDQQI